MDVFNSNNDKDQEEKNDTKDNVHKIINLKTMMTMAIGWHKKMKINKMKSQTSLNAWVLILMINKWMNN